MRSRLTVSCEGDGVEGRSLCCLPLLQLRRGTGGGGRSDRWRRCSTGMVTIETGVIAGFVLLFLILPRIPAQRPNAECGAELFEVVPVKLLQAGGWHGGEPQRPENGSVFDRDGGKQRISERLQEALGGCIVQGGQQRRL